MPAQALANEPPLLVDEVLIRKFIINLSLQVADSRLALVLLVQLGGEQQARESDQLDVAAKASIGQSLNVLQPWARFDSHFRISAPTAFRGECSHLHDPLLEINTCNV